MISGYDGSSFFTFVFLPPITLKVFTYDHIFFFDNFIILEDERFELGSTRK